jgi:hypothetical protein
VRVWQKTLTQPESKKYFLSLTASPNIW